MDEKQVGIIGKYRVERISDPTGKHSDCRFFVLDPQHDLIARRALAYYANDAREEGFTALADDVEAWVRSLWDEVRCWCGASIRRDDEGNGWCLENVYHDPTEGRDA